MQIRRADLDPERRQQRGDLAPMVGLVVEHLHDPESARHPAGQPVAVMLERGGLCEPSGRERARPGQDLGIDLLAASAQL
jgi:hypothetical protein